MDELLAAEQNSPTLELTPPPPEPAADEFSGEVDPLRAGLGTYESSASEKPSIVNAGLWIGLGCLAAVAVAICLFIFFGVGVVSTAIKGNVTSPEGQTVAEKFIYSLETKNFAEAKSLLTKDVRSVVKDSELEGLAKLMIPGEILELEYGQCRAIDNFGGEQFILWYDVNCSDGYTDAIVSVLEKNAGVLIDGVAAMDSSGESFAVGPKSYDELFGEAAGAIAVETVESANFSLPCIAGVIIGIVGIVQLVAVWNIFDRAGQPGWLYWFHFTICGCGRKWRTNPAG